MTLAQQLTRFESLLSGIDSALLASLAPGLDDSGVEALRRALAPTELSAQVEVLYRWRSGGPLPLFFGRAMATPKRLAGATAAAEEGAGLVDGIPVFVGGDGGAVADLEFLLSDLCDAAEAAGDSPYERRAALTGSAPVRPCTTTAADTAETRTIADLVEQSHEAEAVGTVGGRIVDAWDSAGYVEFRLADASHTLVLGIRDPDHESLPALGQELLVTVRIRKGATAITEPIDPRRPSVLGAVPADYLSHSAF